MSPAYCWHILSRYSASTSSVVRQQIQDAYQDFGRCLGTDAFRERVVQDMAQNTDARLDVADDEFRVLEEAFREELPRQNGIEAPIHDDAFEVACTEHNHSPSR